MTDQTVSEVLNRAADLIEERGWTRGVGWHDLHLGGPLCAQGALAAAMGVDSAVGWRCPAYHAVADYIGIKSGLFNWNDKQTDVADVIETLRAAALIEAAKETDVRVVSPRVAVS